MESNVPTELDAIFPFFSTLSKEDRQEALRNASSMTLPRGSVFYDDSMISHSALHIISGTLKFSTLSSEGKEMTLFRLHSGDNSSYMEVPIYSSNGFLLMLQAECDCSIYAINAGYAKRICDNYPSAREFNRQTVISHCANAICSLEQKLCFSTDKRLALFLLEETKRTGSNTLDYTQEQIGLYIGSPRPIVSQAMTALAKLGVIKVRRCQVQVIKKEYLLDVVES